MKHCYFRKQILFWVTLFFFTTYGYGQVPTYYNGTDITQIGDNLKTNLSVLIINTHTTNLIYTPGVWDALRQTDLDPTNSNNVLLIYGYDDNDADIINDRTRGKDMNGGNVGDWNREHTYPRSLGNPNLGSTGPGSDAHHLRASDVQFNAMRNNFPFTDADGNARVIGGNTWYPGDEWKGDVARMIMYMYLRYGDQCLPNAVGTGTQNFHPDMMDIFLEWNAEDPVSSVEINRNVLLEGIQGNRNPFIDNPVFATTVWGGPQAEDRFNSGTTDIEAPSTPENLVTSNTTQTETVLSWDASTDNVGVIAYQIFNGTAQISSVTGTTYTVTGLLPNTSYTFTVKAVDAASNVSLDSNSATITTLEDVIPSILINEVDADTAGTDTMEFVELYDGGAGNSSLDGLVVVMYNGSNNLSYGAYDLDGQTTNAQGYFVLGNTDVPNVNMILPSNGIQNGADAVGIYTGDATDFPSGTEVTTTNLIDALVYDTNDADDAELLVLLNVGEAQINEGAAGDKDAHSSQRFTNGSGGARNTSTYIQAIPTPGAANTNATEPITLVINEVDADTAGTDTLEFVEIYDGGSGNTSLDGFVLVLYNGSSDTSYNAFDLDGQTTNAEGYFVIGNTDVLNVSLVIPGNSLQNGADAVTLYTGDATDFPSGTAITTTNLIDALVYDTNDGDDTGLLPLLNAGQAQINEGELGNKDGHSSQRIPNGDGGARNTTTYTQATPTPGTENGAIITPPDPISILDARNTAIGELVTVSGVLTVSDQFSGSAYIQDTTGGIAIFDEQVHGDGNFMIGDSITVSGTRSAFNDQIQIGSVISVENNGLPNQLITPLTITLSELANYPAELVRIVDPVFPAPGDILFGNSNYVLTDMSGSGQLRIDNDVEEIVGLGQPESCGELVGVVGRFFETYQLLPRMDSDMSCAGPYIPPSLPINVPKDKTLDVVTWNLGWFGDEQNSPPAGNPMSDAIQKDSVKAVIIQLNADIYAIEEISDDALFAQMVSELPGYDYVLSPAVSRPNDPGVKQKVGFIYDTSTVNVSNTRVLLESIHPLYNGGDDSALVNYPSTTDRFYASGRLPFLMTADITIDGQTDQFSIVALHARANSGTGAQNRYDMRKYDVEVLKDSLDSQFANTNLILLGDYNDDVDVTVADVTTTVTTYDEYVMDTTNYNIISKSLSEAGLRSFVFRENMIDHIMISDELNDNYIDQSVRVHYEFYDSDYPFTTADHFPVSARLQLKQFGLAEASSTNVSCNGEADGTATISVSGGISPYTYDWSDGQTTATASGLAAGVYNVIVTDDLGNGVVQEYTIEEPAPIIVTTSNNTRVYIGYPNESCTTLAVTAIEGGSAPYSYEWSTGGTSETLEVCPGETTTYTVTVTDANGCSTTVDIEVEVIDVQCGNNPHRPKVEVCYNGRTRCVPQWVAQRYLKYGAVLGSCDDNTDQVFITDLRVYPNPFRRNLNIRLETNKDTAVEIAIYNFYGEQVFQAQEELNAGQSILHYNLSHLHHGIHYLKIFVDGELKKARVIIKL